MSERQPVTPESLRKRALIAVGISVGLALAAWLGLNRAADVGLKRLEAYDRVRAACAARYAAARTGDDSSHVDESPVSEVLDNGGEGAPRRCGDLKSPGGAARR